MSGVKLKQADQRKHRKCLGCEKQFMSDHPGNRRCGDCSKAFKNGGITDWLPILSISLALYLVWAGVSLR